jgi:predicted nucleic acid-binding Zn ribbon protein
VTHDRHRRSIHTLREAVASFLETSGLSRQTLQDQVGRAWCEIVGPDVVRHTRLGRAIRRGVLRVEVDSPAVLAELSGFRKGELLKGLQERIRRKHIEEIRFKLSSGS